MTPGGKLRSDGGVFIMRINHAASWQNPGAGHFNCLARFSFRPAKSAFLLLALAASCAAATARADESIGGAKSVVNLVTGDLPTGDKISVVQGDDVFKDEGVRTDADSSARLVLRDSTNLLLGPSSSIKLDRFVYSGPKQPGAIAVNLVKGALRFATGDADKKAYVISTPTAALGVRGTVVKILAATPTHTFVQLDEGASIVCMRLGKKLCLELTEPGQTVEVTTTRIRWNSAAGASVSAVIDSIPDSPPGAPGGPAGQHAELTPPVVTTAVVTPPPAAPNGPPNNPGGGGCRGEDGGGGGGISDAAVNSVSVTSHVTGFAGHFGPGHGHGSPGH